MSRNVPHLKRIRTSSFVIVVTAVIAVALDVGRSYAQVCTEQYQIDAMDALAKACRDTGTIDTGLGPMLAADFTASGDGWSISKPKHQTADFDGRPHLGALIRAACSTFKVQDRSGLWVAPPTITQNRTCQGKTATVTWTLEGTKKVHLPDAQNTDPFRDIEVKAKAGDDGTATLTFNNNQKVSRLVFSKPKSPGRADEATAASTAVQPLNNDTCGLVYGTIVIDGHAPTSGTVVEAVDSRTNGQYPKITMDGSTSNYSFGAGVVQVGLYTLRANGMLASATCGACASGSAHWCNAAVNTGGGGCNPTVEIQHSMRKLDLDVAFAVVLPLGLVIGRRRVRRA